MSSTDPPAPKNQPSGLHHAMRRLFEAVLTVNGQGGLESFDSDSLKLFGLDPERDPPRHLRDMLPDALVASILDALVTAAGAGHCTLAPLWMGSANGGRWLEWSASQADADSFLLVVRDATERVLAEDKRLAVERKLRRDEKMASIARLAGGVSNDLRNVLGAILSFAACLHNDLDDDSGYHEVLDRITDACWRGADLASELATIAGDTHMEKRPIAVNDLVREVADLIERAVSPRITVTTKLAEGDSTLIGAATQISQVITNLGLNAVDSMKAGGALTITTECRALTPAEIEAHPDLGPGHYVVLSVIDNGEAMDSASAAHAFEPFYRAAASDENSGLELPLVYSIVRGHHGDLTLSSEPSRGTTVVVYLPAYQPPAVSDRASHRGPSIARAGKILVVDDDAFIRESYRRLLERLGHQVLLAQSGATALEIYRAHGDEIAVVILDLVMPGLNGQETFDKLRAINPDLEVLICSGYPGEVAADELLAEGAIDFLSKPFGLDTLRRALAKTSLAGTSG